MVSKKAFIDADAFVSLHAINNPLYTRSVLTSQKLQDNNYTLYTSTYTILESATVLNMKIKMGLGFEFAKSIYKNSGIYIVEGDKYLERGVEIFGKVKSQNVSLADCIYYAICKSLLINEVFSYDKHWKKNGFNLLSSS